MHQHDATMTGDDLKRAFACGFAAHQFSRTLAVHADCLEWMQRAPAESIHAIVTDPPYGIREYEPEQLAKRSSGRGGVWRIPPAFDGSARAPLPRFTALPPHERNHIRDYFCAWAQQSMRILRPGAHLFVATNAALSALVFAGLHDAGLEFRGQIVRLVRTLRGGNRPKRAEEDFPMVCSMPRGCYEPWGVFRKPIPKGMTVSECLKAFQTGGLRRKPDGNPFEDVIASERTPQRERQIAPHPSLKPQSFLRQVVYAALPLGEGVVLDPFMGSGSTLAAAEAVGYAAIGIERNAEYYAMCQRAVPALARINGTNDARSAPVGACDARV